MQFNSDKVTKIISEIELSSRRLEDLRRMSEEDFLADHHRIGSAKYNFIVAIEGIVDLCQHVIAKNRFRVPDDYADTIRILADRGAFTESFAKKLVQMVRFRNRLVHIYWELDDRELHRILQSHLEDVRTFLSDFRAFIGS